MAAPLRLRVFAPASIGNFGVGFDVLGAAIAPLAGEPWGDTVDIARAHAPAWSCSGPYADRLPADPLDNLVMRAMAGLALPWAVHLHKGLPVGSGLGSSSASAVAGALAGALARGNWPASVLSVPTQAQIVDWKAEHCPELLAAAGQAEAFAAGAAHLDNVAPCLLGGLQLVTAAGPRSLPWPNDWLLVVASPAFALTTKAARAVLPSQVPMGTAVAHAQLLAGFVEAVHRGDPALLQASLVDVLAEPHRAALVPGFHAVQCGALAAGALACTLSGAGPAVFAVCQLPESDRVAAEMAAGFATAGLACTVRVCQIDPIGARWSWVDDLA